LVPETLRANEKPDYKKVSVMYKKYWKTCNSTYIFGAKEKKELPIEMLIDAPAKFNVHIKEDTIVHEMMNYLVNIPNKSTKQTVYVMPILPAGNKKMPENWDQIKDSNFYIINGQHSVAANKLMMEEGSSVSNDV